MLDAFSTAGAMPGERPLEPLFSRFTRGKWWKVRAAEAPTGDRPRWPVGCRTRLPPRAPPRFHQRPRSPGCPSSRPRGQHTGDQVLKGQTPGFSGGRDLDGGARSHSGEHRTVGSIDLNRLFIILDGPDSAGAAIPADETPAGLLPGLPPYFCELVLVHLLHVPLCATRVAPAAIAAPMLLSYRLYTKSPGVRRRRKAPRERRLSTGSPAFPKPLWADSTPPASDGPQPGPHSS